MIISIQDPGGRFLLKCPTSKVEGAALLILSEVQER
jgi:hypothetical protein